MSVVGSWTDGRTDGHTESLPAPLGAVHMRTGSTDLTFCPAFPRSRRIHWIRKVQNRTFLTCGWMFFNTLMSHGTDGSTVPRY